jgi:hypothetical protein
MCHVLCFRDIDGINHVEQAEDLLAEMSRRKVCRAGTRPALGDEMHSYYGVPRIENHA